MLRTNTTTYQPSLQLTLLYVPSSVHLRMDEHVAVRNERERELAIDDTLEASFPASDPPAWNPGLARPIPGDALRHRADYTRASAARDSTVAATPGVIDVSRPYASERTALQALVSLAGAAGVALMVPSTILLVGLPIALGLRGFLETLLWLFPAMR